MTILPLALLCVLALIKTHGQDIRPRSTQTPGTANQNTLDQRLDNLARQISEDLTENRKRTIAVVEFSDLKGNVTNLGRFISEELITRLYLTKKFKVIERQQLNKIIAEQKLSLTGVIDPESAQKLGRVLGVDSVVSGSISDLVKNLKINARLISTETGELFAAAAVEIFKDEAVCSLMGGCGAAAVSPSASPTPVPSSTPRPNGSWIINSHFFTFELKKCRLSGTSVLCDFIITNNERDRRLGLNDSKLFDDFGVEAPTNKSRIANAVNGFFGKPNVLLISGVPTEAQIGFKGVSQNATRITRLDVYWGGDAGNFLIQYRNVPLREQAAPADSSDSHGPQTRGHR